MRVSKYAQLVVITICLIVLLVLPFYTEIHYRIIYYTGVILLIPIAIYRLVCNKKLDERFCKKWSKAREHGFWINVAREGLGSFIFMIAITIMNLLFVHGLTPFEAVLEVSKLSRSQLVVILLFLLAWSLLVGIVAWYEKEKRYHRFLR